VKIYLRTLGCPKNQVDSELLLGLLDRDGHALTERPEEADCLIVNTCAFIDRAKEESVEAILELSRLKTEGRARYLVVSGCLSQRYGAELQAELPEVDAFLGTGDLDRVVEVIRQIDGRRDWVAGAPPGYVYSAETPRILSTGAPYAYVKIAEGCDMDCRFCIIPFMRGPHRSRPLRDIVTEVEGLAQRGIQEVVLVSQDTLAYGRELKGNGDFADLLLALSETSVPWLRFLYVHPAHVNERFLGAFARARVLPYLDMPIQHAADDILKAMRRQVTAKRMAEIIREVRQRIPDVTVRTTVLVGYPGENDAHVAVLTEFMEEMRFDRLGVFAYSREEGTPAAERPDQIPDEVKAGRVQLVEATQERISWDAQRKLLGSAQTILVDGPAQDAAYPWEGRLPSQAPEIDGVVYLTTSTLVPGRFASVRIVEADGHDLIGEAVR